MGSLTAGWQTVPKSTPQAAFKRSSSLTNKAVDKFWRARHNSIREHLEEAQMAAFFMDPSKIEMNDDDYDIKQSTISLPSAPTLNGPQEEGMGKKADWWTKSKFAYLNDPPLMNDTKQSKYTAQFEVALKGGNIIPNRGNAVLKAKSSSFYLF
ncbi:hypothetical protein R1sor_001487 [Riccia sorocarpa]|uniref:Uncharacterized protein n=1 Tax=Riccia sorocarpa TaxID=122646 RepID=A0ABD3GZ84_9MARC